MRIPTFVFAGLIAAIAPMPAAWAEPISYQGQFNDGGEVPVGTYDIRFTVFNASAGGNSVGAVLTRSLPLSASDAGVFSFQDLDFGPGVFIGEPRWIEVAIRTGADAFTVLSPRQPVTATPQAVYASKSGTTLGDAFSNGGVIANAGGNSVQITGGLLLGSSASDGQLRLFLAGAPVPVVQLFAIPGLGGGLRIRDENSNNIALLEADPNGFGSAMTLTGDGGQLVFDGDIGGGANSGSRLSLTGPVSSFVFDTTVGGDASVVLPGSSIGPAELFAEPGIAGATRVNGVGLTSNFVTVTSRTITVPAPGYVVAFASCRLSIQRPTSPGVFGTLIYGLSESPAAIPDTQRNVLQMPGSALTPGPYTFPGSTHGVFEVEIAGDHTFYFNARQTNFTAGTVLDSNLTLLYFPTAYGSVDSSLLLIQGGQGGYSLDASVGPGLSREQILAEQLAEQERAMAEMRAEQARLRRQMEEINARLPREPADR
jgi:hypothetical protein